MHIRLASRPDRIRSPRSPLRPASQMPGCSQPRPAANAKTTAFAPTGRAPAVLGNSGRRLVGARHAVAAARHPTHGTPLARCLGCDSCWDCCAMASLGSSIVAMIRVFSMVKQPGAAGPSMQAGAALAPGVGQQPFKHAAGFWVVGVMSAHATPSSKVPVDGAGFGDQLRKRYRLVRRPVPSGESARFSRS
jgi:hypothetical protein